MKNIIKELYENLHRAYLNYRISEADSRIYALREYIHSLGFALPSPHLGFDSARERMLEETHEDIHVLTKKRDSLIAKLQSLQI